MAKPSAYTRIIKINFDQRNEWFKWLGFDRYKKFIIGACLEYLVSKGQYLKLIKFNVCNDEMTVGGMFPLDPPIAASAEYTSIFYDYVLNPKDSSLLVLHVHKPRSDGEPSFSFSRLMFETGTWERFEVGSFAIPAESLRFLRCFCMERFGVVVIDRTDNKSGIYAVQFNEAIKRADMKCVYNLPAVFKSSKNPLEITPSKIFAYEYKSPLSPLLHVYDANKGIVTERVQGAIECSSYEYFSFVEYNGEIYSVKRKEDSHYLQKLVLTSKNWKFETMVPLFDLYECPICPIQFANSFAFSVRTENDTFRFLILPRLNSPPSLQDIAFRNCQFFHTCSYESLQKLNIPLLLIRKYFGPKWTLQNQQ